MALEFFFDGYQTIPAYTTDPGIPKLFTTDVVTGEWLWVHDPLGPTPIVSMRWHNENNGFFTIRRARFGQEMAVPTFESTNLPVNNPVRPGAIVFEDDLLQFVGDNGISWVNLGGGAGGGGIQSLNGQTGLLFPDQFFVNDANVAISSGGGNHFIGWSGFLPLSRGGLGYGPPVNDGGIPFFDSSSSVSFTATLDSLIVGGGAGVAPFNYAGSACPPGQAVISIDNLGVVTCAADAGTVGPGTTGRLAKFTAASTVGDSIVAETANTLTLSPGSASTQLITTSNAGGAGTLLEVKGGDAAGVNQIGGGVLVLGGAASGSGDGAPVDFRGGGTTSGTGGHAQVIAGGATSGTAGFADLEGGTATSGTGGDVFVTGGPSGSGPAGNVIIARGTGSPSGYVSINSLKYPNADGTPGQVLTTNGAGVLSFASAGTGTVTNSGGAVNQIAVWTSATNITGFADFVWDEAKNNLDVGFTVSDTGAGSNIILGHDNTTDGSDVYILGPTNTGIGGGGSAILGFQNTFSGAGTSFVLGDQNDITGCGSCTAVGIQNTLGNTGTNAALGNFNIVNGGGSGFAVGTGNNSTGSGGNEIMVGTNNIVDDAGGSQAFGIQNNVHGGGNSAAFGMNNVVLVGQTNAILVGQNMNSVADSSLSLGVSVTPEVTITASNVEILGLNYPTTDSAAGTVIMTDGAGHLSLQPLGGGGLSGAGVADRIAVWSGATTMTNFADFTWRNTEALFVASNAATIDASSVTDAAIIGSSGGAIGGISPAGGASGGALIGGSNNSTIGITDSSVFSAAILGSSTGFINNGAAYAGLLGTSGSGITDGSNYVAIVGASNSLIGNYDSACPLVVSATAGSSYSAIAGASCSWLQSATYAFMGGVSQSRIIQGTLGSNPNYVAIVGASDAIIGGAFYSAIAGSSNGFIGDGTVYSFIGGGIGSSIGDGCTSCAVIGDGTVDAGLGNAVAINGGHVTLSNQVALGSQMTLPSVSFTGLPTTVNGSMIYCSDCDPTATLLNCTHAGAQTGAFAYRVNGAWKCMG